ncbi:MAG: cytochrome c, partial [Vicinamibacterales bacterium]
MTRRTIVRAVMLGCFAVAAAVPLAIGSRVAAQDGVEDDILTHFKYGSVGTEPTVGLPYPIWRVLPVLFADKLPKRPGEGWAKLGFIFESGSPQNRPIGTSYVEDRVPLVGLNCATC